MSGAMSSEVCGATMGRSAEKLLNAELELISGDIDSTDYNNLMVCKMARSDQFAEVCFKNQGCGQTKALCNPGVGPNNAE